MTEGVAVSRFVRGSAKKYTQILRVLRGKQIDEALTLLEVLPKPKLKTPVLKTLKSAIANAKYIIGAAKFDSKKFKVVDARADCGPIWKRYRAAPRGRAHMIRKRFSHITIKVSDEEK